MSQSEQRRATLNDKEFSNVSISWVHKLNKENLIIELSRRNLKTTGKLFDLKIRLFKYLRGESTQDDFEIPVKGIYIPDPVTHVEHLLEKNNMADSKNPFFKPGKFLGTISENIDKFLKRFERAAIINGWSIKLVASIFSNITHFLLHKEHYRNYKTNNNNISDKKNYIYPNLRRQSQKKNC